MEVCYLDFQRFALQDIRRWMRAPTTDFHLRALSLLPSAKGITNPQELHPQKTPKNQAGRPRARQRAGAEQRGRGGHSGAAPAESIPASRPCPCTSASFLRKSPRLLHSLFLSRPPARSRRRCQSCPQHSTTLAQQRPRGHRQRGSGCVSGNGSRGSC